MENRFGVRDLIQAVLLLAIIVTVGVSMIQIDRQWKTIQAISKQMTLQTQYTAKLFKEQQAQANNPQILRLQDELVKLRETLQNGVVVAGNIATTQNANAAGTTTGGVQPDKDGIIWGPRTGSDIQPFERIDAAKAMPGYDDKDFFVDVFSVTPDKLTPLISTDIYGSIIQSQILESLAQRNPKTLAWEPLVARWWRISDDGLNIEFELRTNVTFSDSEPLTVDDVLFSFEWMMNDAVESPRQKAYYSKIESVTKVSDTRVRFKFKEPYFQSFELAAGMELLPKHFYGKYTPEQFNRSTGLLMGSGPYRLADPESWRPEPGKPVEVLRNDRYWGPPAPFNRIIWRVIKEDSTRLTAFRNGEIDRMFPTPEQYIAMKKDNELVAKTQHFEYQSPTSGYIYVGWAQKTEGKPTIYADARVRRAMTMLTDRVKICNEIFYGYAIPISGPFNPLSPQTNPDITPWPYDAAAARKLLTEAGFKDTDNDGLLNAPDGKPLIVKISYPSASETYNRVVLLMKDNFAKAGVILQEDPLEWNVLLERMKNRQLDAYMLGWSGSIEGDPFQIFHSSMIEGTGDNTVSYANPKLDQLLEEARTTVDEAKRMKLWHQVHAIMHEDQPYTFLMTRKSTVFAAERLKNIQVVKNGLNPEIEWYVSQGQAKWAKP